MDGAALGLCRPVADAGRERLEPARAERPVHRAREPEPLPAHLYTYLVTRLLYLCGTK